MTMPFPRRTTVVPTVVSGGADEVGTSVPKLSQWPYRV
jgi:hypothetical protein